MKMKFNCSALKSFWSYSSINFKIFLLLIIYCLSGHQTLKEEEERKRKEQVDKRGMLMRSNHLPCSS